MQYWSQNTICGMVSGKWSSVLLGRRCLRDGCFRGMSLASHEEMIMTQLVITLISVLFDLCNAVRVVFAHRFQILRASSSGKNLRSKFARYPARWTTLLLIRKFIGCF